MASIADVLRRSLGRLTGPITRHPAFRRLLAGQVGFAFGAQAGALAVPTIAIVGLHASPMDVGILAALPWLPAPILGMPIGVLVDRLPRRPLMIGSEAGRWLVLIALTTLVISRTETLYHLYVASLVLGLIGTVYDIAYQSFMPSTLSEDELLDANSVVDVAKTPALVGGPALGGALISGIGPASALVAYCAGSLASLLSLRGIQTREPVGRPEKRSLLNDLVAGVRLVLGNPTLRTIATAGAISNLGAFMFSAVSLVFAYRDLGLSPILVGSVLAVGNLGYLIGAAAAPMWVSELGLGRTLALSQLFLAISLFVTPLSLLAAPVAVFAISQLLQNLTSEVFGLNQVSLRQAITPRELQGRMNATVRVGIVGAVPVGTLLGGYLGTTLGVVETMLIGAAISLAAPLFILSAPLIRLRRIEVQPVVPLALVELAETLVAEPV